MQDTIDFSTVTELDGALVSTAQIVRVLQRYFWAGEYCRDKVVLEVACGAGHGLGYLSSVSRQLSAGDITPSLVARARENTNGQVNVSQMTAENLPYQAESLDVVILFEAIYYLESAEAFINECARVLRPGGVLLLATANKDLYDFNPSPFSVQYFNPPELNALLEKYGFKSKFFGGSPVDVESMRGRIFRRLKKLAVYYGFIPKSMGGKKWLKRLIFGQLVPMPTDIRSESKFQYVEPIPIENHTPDVTHQVIYCAAQLR